MTPEPTDLEQLRVALGECGGCALAQTRSRIVFGTGDPHARVMIVGEAPGRNEDLKGEPFVGAAGKLLDELLAHAGLERRDVYIANVLKCRPPDNRDPEPAEIDACAPVLREQVRLIDPQVIVTLGNFATRFVLKTTAPISALRGRVHKTGRFTVLPIFHPAAAIYDRTKRDVLFEDFGLLKRLLAEDPEARDAAERRNAMRTADESSTQECGRAVAPLLQAGDVLLLTGDLGAGKTQLTKGIAAGLGVKEPVTSPTFNILLIHEGRIPLYHFDLYRLERAEELEDLDYFATLEADGVAIVEWGDRFAEAAPADGLLVTVHIEGDEEREIKLKPLGPRGAELASAWMIACRGSGAAAESGRS